MLKHLYINNYALIDVLNIDLHPGFSVITGETGAGKSIILGAIALLLGQRADTKSIKDCNKKCSIEAHFDLTRYNLKEWFDNNDLEYDAEDCIIRRELSPTGKSRGFINDTPATLQQMKELGEMLIDVHSQHQNLLLQKENFQLNVLDILADNENLRKTYSSAYKSYKTKKAELEKLRQDILQAKSNEEFMRFQLNELTSANLTDGEQETLEEEQSIATHTEEIKGLLYETNNLLNDDDNGILSKMSSTCQRLDNAAGIYQKIVSLAERMNSVMIETKDIAHEVETETAAVDFDPERLSFINERLDKIYSLERKYQKQTVKELLDEQDALQEAINKIDYSDDMLTTKEKEVDELLKDASYKAEELTKSRKKITTLLKKEIKEKLTLLGMPNVEFDVELSTRPLDNNGQDNVSFLFSANKGMALRPVAQVASGGEIARLMLTLKALISKAVKLPTIIFDEIDTGVSGKIAEQMAAIMQDMGKTDRQVISITHLPQIAAIGKHHYKVEKLDVADVTTSSMRLLSEDERIVEIAQMLSGSNITEAAKSQARELLSIG